MGEKGFPCIDAFTVGYHFFVTDVSDWQGSRSQERPSIIFLIPFVFRLNK